MLFSHRTPNVLFRLIKIYENVDGKIRWSLVLFHFIEMPVKMREQTANTHTVRFVYSWLSVLYGEMWTRIMAVDKNEGLAKLNASVEIVHGHALYIRRTTLAASYYRKWFSSNICYWRGFELEILRFESGSKHSARVVVRWIIFLRHHFAYMVGLAGPFDQCWEQLLRMWVAKRLENRSDMPPIADSHFSSRHHLIWMTNYFFHILPFMLRMQPHSPPSDIS